MARRGTTSIIVSAALALLAVACSSGGSSARSGSPSVGGSATSASPVAYSACMRSHGVPNYPDPGSDGNLPKGNAQAFGVSTSQYQDAQRACRLVLPNNDRAFIASLIQCLETGDCPQALVQRALTEGRTFAQCMRSQGVPNWPDPVIDSMGRPSFQVTAAGISIRDTRSSEMLSKIGHCERQAGAVLLRQE